jgi:hypothetical protein
MTEIVDCIYTKQNCYLQPHFLALHLINVLWLAVQLHTHIAACLIHQVNGLQK